LHDEPLQPREIYHRVTQHIDNLESSIVKLNEDEISNEAKENTLTMLRGFKTAKIDNAISDLEKYGEWDTYTIAFFGETNAGKSTIIEALRIFFQESTKCEAQNEFSKILKNFDDHLIQLNQNILDIKEFNANPIGEKVDIIGEEIESQIKKVQTLINEKKEQSIWYRLLIFFKVDSLCKRVKLLHSTKKQFEELKHSFVNKAILFADGQIMGDGRSDFTREFIPYLFTKNNQKFSILDVPGIEGNESAVIDEISSAVKKAHAVFYITGNPVPPQKGDENKKGTLEKIKEHLSAQTEVYTIYNKRITNPVQLQKPLLSDDDHKSLEILNEKMREELGECYGTNINLSAQIAFLALAECLIPSSKHAEEQNKFLLKLSPKELLSKSDLHKFGEFLINDLVQNTEQKIKKSNFNKVNEILKQFLLILDTLSKEKKKEHSEYKHKLANTEQEIENSLRATKNKFKTHLITTTRKFSNSLRDNMYTYIDRDVSNDDFQRKLKSLLIEEQKKLANELPKKFEQEKEKFLEEIKRIHQHFIQKAIEIEKNFSNVSINEQNLKLHININNGINGWGVTGSAAGAGMLAYSVVTATNAWNPFGWTMFAIGAITVLISFAKSIIGFFSSDYKMSQQREQADNNIDRISEQIEESIESQLENFYNVFEGAIQQIIEILMIKIDKTKEVQELIGTVIDNVQALSNKIKSEGNI